MAERIVSMHAAHRSGKAVVAGFISRPSAGGERPATVLVHGYRGLDDGQRGVTRRFAQQGFVCLSPDIFHGKTYHPLEDCALKQTSLDIAQAVNNIVEMHPGAGHAFLNNASTKSAANRAPPINRWRARPSG